jgi:hypothetical protein
VDYVLDVPMYFVYRNKKYIDCTGMSFRVSFYLKCPIISVKKAKGPQLSWLGLPSSNSRSRVRSPGGTNFGPR